MKRKNIFLYAMLSLLLCTPLFTPFHSPSAQEHSEGETFQTANQVQFFETSSPRLTEQLNTFWNIYGINVHSPNDQYGKVYGDNNAWTEWDALKFHWTNYNNHRKHVEQFLNRGVKVNGYNAAGTQADGYIWSWGSQEKWPDGNYHFDQIPRFINAIHELYMWTRNDQFLENILPKAELVMEQYMLNEMGGDEGVLEMPGTLNDGTPNSAPSTYMDQIKSGHQDAWINVAFYSALKNMEVLMLASGEKKKSVQYKVLANRFANQFDKAFWNKETSRYGLWRDIEGNLHDYGYTHINLEALVRGLGNKNKAESIFTWIDQQPATPTIGGATPGSTDVYQHVVAPRMNTIPIDTDYWDGWSDPAEGKKKYGSIIQDGGTALWFNYYDVMARLQYQGADAAFEKLTTMLERMMADPNYLTFNPSKQRFWNSFGEDLVELGSNDPFPESGINIVAIIRGFMGMEADLDGLHITPNLPSDLTYITAHYVNYKGKEFSITIRRGEKDQTYKIEIPALNINESVRAGKSLTIAEVEPDPETDPPIMRIPERLTEGNVLGQSFQAATPFNQLVLNTPTWTARDSGYTVTLKKDGPQGEVIFTENIVNANDGNDYINIATQEAGHYYVEISHPIGSIGWWTVDDIKPDGHAYLNGNPIYEEDRLMEIRLIN